MSCGVKGHPPFDRECPTRKASLKERSKLERKKEKNRAMSRHRMFQQRSRDCPQANTQWEEIKSMPGQAMAVIMTAIVSCITIEKKSPGEFQKNFNHILNYNSISRVALPSDIISKMSKSTLPDDRIPVDLNPQEEDPYDSDPLSFPGFCSMKEYDEILDRSNLRSSTLEEVMDPTIGRNRDAPLGRQEVDQMQSNMEDKEDRGCSRAELPLQEVKTQKNERKEETQRITTPSSMADLKSRKARVFFPTTLLEKDGGIDKN